MGQREQFSTSDLAKINKMYKCENIETTTLPETTTEESTSVSPSPENGSVYGNSGPTESSTSSTVVPTERPPNSNNSYPVLEFLSGLYNVWNAGK